MSTRDPLHSREIDPRFDLDATSCARAPRQSRPPARRRRRRAPTSCPRSSTAASRATRRPAWSTRPASPPSSGSASLSVKDESQPARPALVQDPRRIVGGLPAARRPARPRTGVARPRRAARRARAARTAHARGRDRRQPRPRGRAHGPAARLRGAHLRARGNRGRRASTPSKARARRSPSSTAPTTTRCARRPRSRADDVLVVSDTSWEGYTEVPRTVIEGYATIFAEVDEQLADAPDVVVVPMGVGALAAAVVQHYAPRATIVVVEPLSAACGLHSAEAGHPVEVPGPHDSIMAGLNCGMVSIIAWPTVSAGADVFVAVDDAAAEHAMRDLARDRHRRGRDGRAPPLAGLARRGRRRPARTRAASASSCCAPKAQPTPSRTSASWGARRDADQRGRRRRRTRARIVGIVPRRRRVAMRHGAKPSGAACAEPVEPAKNGARKSTTVAPHAASPPQSTASGSTGASSMISGTATASTVSRS